MPQATDLPVRTVNTTPAKGSTTETIIRRNVVNGTNMSQATDQTVGIIDAVPAKGSATDPVIRSTALNSQAHRRLPRHIPLLQL